jgi:vancomycin aglycone glucosyltransferase
METDPETVAELWRKHRRGWNARALERVNANRARLGLAAIDDVLDHILGDQPWLACDAVLGPAPLGGGRDVIQTGAWLPPDAQPLPADVEAFLEVGEAPVYLGLGSMPAAPEAGRALISAARAVGRRAILSEGWAGFGLADDGADCLLVAEVNHQALFPRVAAVVHHGGAGTTTAAALAGVPQVVAPMFSDQFYWASRVADLGIGTSAAGPGAEALAVALDAALKPEVAARSGSIAGKVASDGAARAARRLASRVQ